MHPTLFHIGSFAVSSYTVALAVAFVVAFLVKRRESRRLGYAAEPGFRWLGLAALFGAAVGSKLGMLLYLPHAEWWARVTATGPSGGRTVLGALAGGYFGVVLAKRALGIRHSTGDAFAVAIPLAQGIGRVGCLLAGCCYGAPSSAPWAVRIAGEMRHPVQLYEALLDLLLAALLYFTRHWKRAEGHLFRTFLVGYAIIRFSVDPLRGDPRVELGPLSAAQLLCVVTAVGFTLAMLRARRADTDDAPH